MYRTTRSIYLWMFPATLHAFFSRTQQLSGDIIVILQATSRILLHAGFRLSDAFFQYVHWFCDILHNCVMQCIVYSRIIYFFINVYFKLAAIFF